MDKKAYVKNIRYYQIILISYNLLIDFHILTVFK